MNDPTNSATHWNSEQELGTFAFANPEDARKAVTLFNRLTIALEAEAKDAARYRWLRDVAHTVEDSPVMLDLDGSVFTEETDDQHPAIIDKVIDAAMSDSSGRS